MKSALKKAKLRTKMLSWRRGLDQRQVQQASDAVCEHLTSLSVVKQARHVYCYVSFDNEVDTYHLIDWLTSHGKHVSVPAFDGESYRPALFTGWKDIIPGKQAPQPKIPEFIDPSSIDLAICPGVAFDETGARLGFGGGHYDTLLSRLPTATKIGLCYQQQLIKTIPLEPTDVTMDIVVTDQEIVYVPQKT